MTGIVKQPDYPFLNNVNVDPRLLGFPLILSPFAQQDSSPRINMLNHHLSQTMIVDKPEMNKLFTGMEEKFIDYTFNSSKREFDCEILELIPKYTDALVHGVKCPQFYVLTLTHEPNGVKRLDYFTIDRYFMGQNDFGWIPQITPNYRQVKKGEYLTKDTPITHSPAVNGNAYMPGLNLNVCYGSFTETIEDAFVISESAARRLQTTQISQKVINCRMDRRPLNLNGTETIDKFLPDIGDFVREDGILCAQRPVHWTTCLADTDPVALREPLPLQDDIIYVEGGAKILDKTYNINRNKINHSSYEQAWKYDQNNLKCWESIYQTYMRYKADYRLTPKMSTLVRTAIYRMIASGTKTPWFNDRFRKAMKNFEVEGHGGQIVDFLQIVVTYAVPRPVSKGTKLSDFHGAKGVVGVVYPDDWMPIDEYGFRADMIIDMNSPVSRNNFGQLYESGVNRVGEFARRECQRVYELKGTEAAHETLLDYFNDINPNYANLVRSKDVTSKDRKDTVEEAIEKGIIVWIPPYLDTFTPSDDDFHNALTNMRKLANKWGAKPSVIRFKTLQADGTGKEFVSEVPFSIGSKYIIHLHKIPEITAPGPASVNHINVPVKAAYEAKNYPVSTNPYRYGEDELRVISMDVPIEEVTRLQNLQANSPKGAEASIRAILTEEHPTRIKRMPISNGTLAESSSVLKLVHSTSAALGVETKNTRNDVLTSRLMDMVAKSNELVESISATDIVTERDSETEPSKPQNKSTKRHNQKREKVKKMIDSMGLAPDEEEEAVAELIDEEQE